MTKSHIRLRSTVGSALLAATLALFTGLSASPARADRCEDIANQLKNGIDGLKVNFAARNTIYLTHRSAKELSLGCRGQNYSLEFYAKGDRKPKPEFLSLVGATAAIVFTVPKDDTTTGTTRCLKRMGLLRGDKVSMRFRRLSLECEASQLRSLL